MFYWGHPFMRHQYGGQFGWVGIVLGILLLVLLVLLIIWAVRSGKRSPLSAGHSPFDIARERYAKGEISLAEFEEIKKNLG
jgi:putative membrane protein